MRHILSRFFGSPAKTQRPAPAKKTTLHVESLESRNLMSVTSATLTDGHLRVAADGGHDDIEIRQVTSGPIILLNAPGGTTVPKNAIIVRDRSSAAGQSWTFDAAEVKQIEVDLGDGRDRLVSDAALPTQVKAGAGNDLVETGSSSDTLMGGTGDDTLVGHGGDDILNGEEDNDALHGHAGHDIMFGGDGLNSLLGHAGNDHVVSSSRLDVVDGHEDYDSLFVLAGTRSVLNGEHVTINTPLDQPQTDSFSCGPNSGSRMLRAYGFDNRASYAALRNKVKAESPLFRFKFGTRPKVLHKVLTGFDSTLRLRTKASLQDVLDKLAAGKPVVALVALKTKSLSIAGKIGLMHYVVLNGFDLATQRINFVNTNGSPESWTFQEFDKKWKWFDEFTGPVGGAGQALLERMGLQKRTFIA